MVNIQRKYWRFRRKSFFYLNHLTEVGNKWSYSGKFRVCRKGRFLGPDCNFPTVWGALCL